MQSFDLYPEEAIYISKYLPSYPSPLSAASVPIILSVCPELSGSLPVLFSGPVDI
jgi:hypothetical protein